MKIVYKYKVTDASIKLPIRYKILKVGVQEGKFYVWALVDIDEEIKEEVNLCIYGTGWPVPYNAEFIDTVFSGEFVWHIFKV